MTTSMFSSGTPPALHSFSRAHRYRSVRYDARVKSLMIMATLSPGATFSRSGALPMGAARASFTAAPKSSDDGVVVEVHPGDVYIVLKVEFKFCFAVGHVDFLHLSYLPFSNSRICG
jgi:hypothetical protein